MREKEEDLKEMKQIKKMKKKEKSNLNDTDGEPSYSLNNAVAVWLVQVEDRPLFRLKKHRKEVQESKDRDEEDEEKTKKEKEREKEKGEGSFTSKKQEKHAVAMQVGWEEKAKRQKFTLSY